MRPHTNVISIQFVCVAAQQCVCWLKCQSKKIQTSLTLKFEIFIRRRPCVGRFVLSSAGAIRPLVPPLPPSPHHPPLLSVGGVSGGRRRRLLQWQQGPPLVMLHCSSTVTLGRNTETYH